jgi:glycosyltransferase involved in cell wall biosynthesis
VTQNKKNPKKIAFVGRLTPIKNPELFIDAIKYVVSKNISVEAIILGEGPLLQLLLNKIDLLNLKEVIKIEFSAEPLSYLMESSIFTSLQKGDNYGSQSLLEAMGQSCAIVATNVGETGKLISDDVGILIDPTTEQLGEALIKLLLNPNLAYELGVNASTKATCQYNADKYIEYLEELYEKSLSLFNNPNTLY